MYNVLIQNACFTSAIEQSVLLYPFSSDRLLRSQVCDQKADPWWYYYWGGGGGSRPETVSARADRMVVFGKGWRLNWFYIDRRYILKKYGNRGIENVKPVGSPFFLYKRLPPMDSYVDLKSLPL